MTSDIRMEHEGIDRARIASMVQEARELVKNVGRLGTISETFEEALHWAAGFSERPPTGVLLEVEQALVHLRGVRLGIRLHVGQHDLFWKSVSAVLAAMVGIIAHDLQDSNWTRAITFAAPSLVLALFSYFIAGQVARWKEVIASLDVAIAAFERVVNASADKASSASSPGVGALS